MTNNKISFGNSIGFTVTEYITKKKLLDLLFQSVDSFKLNEKEIKEEDDLITIKNGQYSIYPNIAGEDYIFMANKIKDKYYAVLIEKKNLNDDLDINYNLINIIGLRIRLTIDSYNGTIFDGRLVNLGGCSVFIINDCYLLNGGDYDGDRKILNTFINDSVIVDNNMNTIHFKINKIYELNDIDNVVNKKIKTSNYNVTSLVFSPKNDNIKYVHRICSITEQNLKRNFLAKLKDTDVVELFAYDDTNNLKKVGIAHIPTIKSSHICNQHIPMEDYVKVVCKLNVNFIKWQPIEIINNESNDIAKYDEVKNCVKNIIASV